MGRTTSLASSIAVLKKQINLCESYKQELIDYSQKLLKQYIIGKISAFEYSQLLNQKLNHRTLQEWLDYYDNYIEKCKDHIVKHREKQLAKKALVFVVSIFAFTLLISSLFYIKPVFQGLVIKENITQTNISEVNITEEVHEEVGPSQESPLSSGNIINITLPQDNITEPIQDNITEPIQEDLVIQETDVTVTTRKYQAVIGRPVKWVKIVQIENPEIVKNLTIDLPKKAENITIKIGIDAQESIDEIEDYIGLVEAVEREKIISKEITGNVALDIKKSLNLLTKFWNWIIGLFTNWRITNYAVFEEQEIEQEITETQDSKEIDLADIAPNEDEMIVEYYTDAPQAQEQELPNGKRITITGPDDIHYQDVLAYTVLEQQAPENAIRLYHIVDGERQLAEFDAYDLNEDGLIDYVEWIIPHLSEQVYELLTIQQCWAQDEVASAGTWNAGCDNTYPGDALFYDDATYEVHTISKTKNSEWAGIRTNSYNTSVIDCNTILNVSFCYKWWAGTTRIQNCDISVDADAGASYSLVDAICPGTTEPGSMTCVDVTSLENWECNDFFGGSAIGAYAKSEIEHSGGGPGGSIDITWDVFYFNISYDDAETIKPIVVLVSPANYSGDGDGNVEFICNATNVQLANMTLYWNYTGTWQANETKIISGAFNQTTFNRTGLNDGAFSWNCYACDSANNCDFTPFNWTLTINTTDLTPPNAINNLINISNGATYILWNWTNPTDIDFYENIIYLDDANVMNTSNHSYYASGLTGNSSYTIRINTLDLSGNINYTNITNTSRTTVAIDSLFFDDFEVYTLAENNWTNTGTGTAWTRETIDAYSGAYHLYTENTDTESIIQRNISTEGYINIDFSFYAYTDGLDAGEYVAADWYNGTYWVSALPETEDIAAYTLYSYSLTEEANQNSDFAIRFRCLSGNNNEECYVEDVRVEGECGDYIPPSSVTNLTNITQDTSWIYWNWTNPTDADFEQNIIYVNGINIANTSNNFYNATGLVYNTNYTITINTQDLSGNINITNVSNTAKTLLPDFSPTVHLSLPLNNSIDPDGNITFICNATDDSNLVNITFYWNYNGTWLANGTQSATGTYVQKTFQKNNLNESNIIWNCHACDNASQCNFSSANYTTRISLGWLTPTSIFAYCGDESNAKANYTIDFDTGTYWRHAIDERHHITYDLGQDYVITNLRIYDGSTSTSLCNVTVWLSSDTSFSQDEIVTQNWTIPKANTGWQTRNFNESQGRYLKLEFDIQKSAGCTVSALPTSTFSEIQVNNLSEAQYAPQIKYVSPLPNINPIEASFTSVNLTTSVYDQNGVTDIDANFVIANFTRQGQTIRTGSCTHQNNIDAYTANFSCSVDMWYFDQAGDWNISVYAEDITGLSDINDSTSFQYNLLQAIVISPNAINFDTGTATINATALNHPTTINNTGNFNCSKKIAVNAIDLYSGANRFVVENFTIGISSGTGSCIENSMQNGTDINITGVILETGNLSAGEAQEELFYCISEVPNLPTGTYDTTTAGSWTIEIVIALAVFIPSTKSKKKKKSKKKTKKQEQEIPITIFTNRLGVLEALVKYMKEELGMRYHEIAKILNRDDRTIWMTYHRALKKQKRTIKVKTTMLHIPISILKNRELTTFGAIVVYLKDKGLRYVEIAELLNRDQRNIWTIYSRILKKHR